MGGTTIRWSIFTAIAALVLVTGPVANLATAAHSPTDPVMNGDFETGNTVGEISSTIENSPADVCIGVGHQAFWNEDTPQQFVLGDSRDPSPQPTGAGALVQAYADGERDPLKDAEEQSGVGHCDGEAGSDVLWIVPEERSETPLFWSTATGPDRAVEFGFAFDDDPFDREIRIPGGGAGSGHNLWQSGPALQQGYTANFDAYRFTVEDGQIPSKAKIEVSVSLTPGYAQHPFVGVFYEGQIVFRADAMQPDATGLVELDPLEDGRIACPNNYPPCDRFKAAYEAADEDGKRELLGQTRIVQNSFWSFNRGPGAVVLDDISIVGATTVAEELASGNLNPNPLPDTV